jgi:uncharacterized protein
VNACADIATRVAAFDWSGIATELDTFGYATLPRCLTPAECAGVIGLYAQAQRFRRRIVMQQHGYGSGDYQYFAYPLPALVADMRAAFYAQLVATANRWSERLRSDLRYPAQHQAFVERCHAHGQRRPTPLVLHYATGDYNRLHQDLYGEHAFPLQVAVLLSRPERDFSGGEFVLTTQRPRVQSRVDVVPLGLGDAVVFAVAQRPEPGMRGFHRVAMRHGVSPLRSGERYALGVIFHDAK